MCAHARTHMCAHVLALAVTSTQVSFSFVLGCLQRGVDTCPLSTSGSTSGHSAALAPGSAWHSTPSSRSLAPVTLALLFRPGRALLSLRGCRKLALLPGITLVHLLIRAALYLK